MDEIKVIRIIEENVEKALQYLIDRAHQELKDQGHRLTGNLERSFKFTIDGLKTDCVNGKILHADYGLTLDQGIKRSKVPFSRPSGRGGRSKYIEGLIDFFRKRGKTLKEAKSFAFATAMKAKQRTGHPTRPYFAGRTHSSNGRRTGWTKIAYSKTNIDEFTRILRFSDFAEELVFQIVNSANNAA